MSHATSNCLDPAAVARALRRITVALLALFALGARAADDWIDELPSVTAVARAVAEQLKVDTADWRFDARGVSLKDDDDLFAVYVVGTLVLLRQIMLYEYQGEAEPLAPEREAKLRSIVAAYLEAELLIGQGVGKRRGYLTTAQKCRDMDCYRRWFKMGASNVRGAAYRRRMLARLFPCDPARATELNDLAQSYAVRAPYLPSPADTLTIEPEMAGVAPAGCSVYGGDANGNGLCDDWENPSAPPIVLDKARMAAGGGLRVTLAKGGGAPGATACFRVLRAEKPKIDAGPQQKVWSGAAAIQRAAAPDATLHVVVAQGADLTPDPSHPYLLVEVTSGGTAGPVHCEQPLVTWLQRQLDSGPEGLHGPYARADVAVLTAGKIALEITQSFECGFLIGREMTKGGYYATAPVCGTDSDDFPVEDYKRSHEKAFATSCEDPLNFALAATVHTHPKSPVAAIDERNDYFSMTDFNQAVAQKKNDSTYEKSYMVSKRSRCIESFVPKLPEDRELTFTEMHIESVLGQIPAFAPLYLQYVGRMETIKCF